MHNPRRTSIKIYTYNTVGLKQFLGRAPRIGQARGPKNVIFRVQKS